MKKRKIIALFIACLLLFTVITSNAVAKHNKPKKRDTVYVDDDYYDPKKPSDGTKQRPYTTIQQGIDSANPGNTVFVYSGTYYENVILNKAIDLVGENKYSTIIQGSEFVGYDVYITVDWVNITGFTMKGSYVDGSLFGVGLYYSNHCTISDNIIPTHYSFGIELDHSSYNTITDNNVSDNTETGIILGYSTYNTISDNKVTGNNDWGIWLSFGSNNNNITDNNINANQWGNIRLDDSNNNIISGNNASNCGAGSGIELWYSSNNNIVKGNIIINSDYLGISISSSNNNLIYNNFLNNTQYSWNGNANDDGNNIWNIDKTLGTNIISGPYLGGNYWSDYTGVDTDADGLGDTPYNIPGGSNQDMHPLVLPQFTKTTNKDKMLDTPLLNFLERFPVLYQLLQMVYQLVQKLLIQ